MTVFIRIFVWCYGFLWITIDKSKKTRKNETAPIIVSNHHTIWDANLVYAMRFGNMSAVGKVEVFETPLFGRICRAIGGYL